MIKSIGLIPKVEGPILSTEKSHPFSAMNFSRGKLDLSKHGYLEEEYFLSGTANVYDEVDSKVEIVDTGLAYKNRVMVRRPKDASKFSGRVYLDIYNATNGYDIEDLWRRSYQHFMENGDIYVGITSKPINVVSLKNFDLNRYESLSWPSKTVAAQPAVPDANMTIRGTEEGLVWDIISQTANLLRDDNNPGILGGLKPEFLYLVGQSQSGIYLNTYINYFHEYLVGSSGSNLFDGYLNIVGTGIQRPLKQDDDALIPLSMKEPLINKINIPFITITSEGDYDLFGGMPMGLIRMENSDDRDNLIRYYEVAGAPHSDPLSPVIPDNSEIIKTKNPPRILDGEVDFTVNDMPLNYYINGIIEHLHTWAKLGQVPPVIPNLELDEAGEIKRDEHGNALGGLRSPFLDVPRASYLGAASMGATMGSMRYFTKEEINTLYGSYEKYLEQFVNSTNKQVEEQWITKSDGLKMIEWAKNYKGEM